MSSWPGVIETYRAELDLEPEVQPVTLLEGNTPLIPAPRIAAELGAESFYVKFEGLNPTGSFKDRGMTVAISQAVHEGAESVICASTGNTAASAAAYGARAGLKCYVLIPEGKVAAGKLAGAVAYGADVIQVQGSFDDALRLVRQLVEQTPALALVNSINPYRLEGQKTAAYEIIDRLGGMPGWLALPVGNAGNITSYWMGFRSRMEQTQETLPRLLGVQAAGAAPLALGKEVPQPETVATAIRIGRPARGDQALAAADESKGRIIATEDEVILKAQRRLAAEGIWVEPASAAGLAGLLHEKKQGRLDLKGQSVVCICTGHGLKDPEVITKRTPTPTLIEANLTALQKVLGL